MSFETLAGAAAVRPFVERANAIDAYFSLTAANAPAVGQICRRLDGIPLTIEVAASRISMLTAEQIADRLDNGFQFLAGASRTGPTRQQTMDATLGWSYDRADSQDTYPPTHSPPPGGEFRVGGTPCTSSNFERLAAIKAAS